MHVSVRICAQSLARASIDLLFHQTWLVSHLVTTAYIVVVWALRRSNTTSFFLLAFALFSIVLLDIHVITAEIIHHIFIVVNCLTNRIELRMEVPIIKVWLGIVVGDFLFFVGSTLVGWPRAVLVPHIFCWWYCTTHFKQKFKLKFDIKRMVLI